MIREDVARIRRALKSRLACEDYSVIALPQLFSPSRVRERYGVDEEAAALHPNLVNGVSLGTQLLLPSQPSSVLQQAVVEALRPTGLTLWFLDADHLHRLGGGLHCATNVVRACTPDKPVVVDKAPPE